MIAPARTVALRALEALARGTVDLPGALASTRALLSDDRDRALAADIVTGSIRWRRELDHLITLAADRPLEKIDPAIRLVLQLSVYQLLHLDRVPAAAIVDDAVDLARAVRRSSAAGFVNAVLRSIVRWRSRLPLPARPDDARDRPGALAYLGVTHSHPAWLIERWLDRYGLAAAERWVTFNNQRPAVTLRANPLRISRDELARQLAADDIVTTPTRYAPDGLTVVAGNPLAAPPSGLFSVQDEASQLVALTVDARPGERILDLCAAPGGKTTALAGDLRGNGIIVATDVRRRRVKLLAETVRASGASQVHVVRLAPQGPLPFRTPFDRVLVDAPCTGLGTIRRDPDVRWRRTPEDLPRFARAQLALLDRAAAVVADGGRLVYATCSSEPEENEAVVLGFLDEHPEFTRLDLAREGPAVLAPLIDAQGFLRTLPFEHQLEAFFAAALQRRG